MKTKKILASVLIGSLALSSFPTNIFANNLTPAEEKLCAIQGNVEEIFSDKRGNLYTIFNKDFKINYETENFIKNGTPINSVNNAFLVKNGEKIGGEFDILTANSKTQDFDRFFFSTDGKVAFISSDFKTIIDGEKTNTNYLDFFVKNYAGKKHNFVFEENNLNHSLYAKTYNGKNYHLHYTYENGKKVGFQIYETDFKEEQGLPNKITKLTGLEKYNLTNQIVLNKISNSGEFYFSKEFIDSSNVKYSTDMINEDEKKRIIKYNLEKNHYYNFENAYDNFYIDNKGNIYSSFRTTIHKKNLDQAFNIEDTKYVDYTKDFSGFKEFGVGKVFLNPIEMVQERGDDIYFISRNGEEVSDGINIFTTIYKNGQIFKEFETKIKDKILKDYFINYKRNSTFEKGDLNSKVFLQDYIDYNGNLYTYRYTGSVKEIFKNGKNLCNPETNSNTNNQGNNPVNPINNPTINNGEIGGSSPTPESLVIPNNPNVTTVDELNRETEIENSKKFFREMSDVEFAKNKSFNSIGYEELMRSGEFGKDTLKFKIQDDIENIFVEESYNTLKKIHKKLGEKNIQELKDESLFVEYFIEEFEKNFEEMEFYIDSLIYAFPKEEIKKIKDRVKNFFNDKDNKKSLKKIHEILKSDLSMKKRIKTSQEIYYVFDQISLWLNLYDINTNGIEEYFSSDYDDIINLTENKKIEAFKEYQKNFKK